MKNFKLVISKSIDPFFNTAMDEYLLRLAGGRAVPPVVRFYKNRDSVILGKYQCPEIEVNEKYCAENNIPVIKRISGGGAVFHDEGNLNIAIYVSADKMPSVYVRESLIAYSGAVKKAIESFGIETETDERGAIFINGKKVSGCAGAKKFGGFLYHATLLLNADTEKLKKALKPEKTEIPQGKRCVRSNRSEVVNLYDVKFVPEKELLLSVFYEVDKT